MVCSELQRLSFFRVETSDSEVYHAEPEPKKLPGGPGPQQRVQEKQLVAQEEHEQEDTEELRALPPPPTSLDGENRGIRTRDPVLALEGPLLMEGLADAALEDGECLRHCHCPWCLSNIASFSPSTCSKVLTSCT